MPKFQSRNEHYEKHIKGSAPVFLSPFEFILALWRARIFNAQRPGHDYGLIFPPVPVKTGTDPFMLAN
jgi:hypothetical protein